MASGQQDVVVDHGDGLRWMESRRGRRPGGAGEWIGARVAGCRARRFYSSGRRAWSRPIGSHGDVASSDARPYKKKKDCFLEQVRWTTGLCWAQRQDG
jgi:hypothetical protein